MGETGEVGNPTSQILFSAFCLVREKWEEKNLHIRANQTSCESVGMRAFLSKTMFGFNESHAKLSHQLKTLVRGVTSTMLMPRLAICKFR